MMFKVPSNSPQRQVKTFAAVSEQSSPNKPFRPGWLEIIVGLVVFGAVARGGGLLSGQLGLDPVVYGLALAALSVIAPFAGFAAAVLLRIRSLHAFGVRRISWRWLLIGVGAGVVAFVVKGFAVMAYTAPTGTATPRRIAWGKHQRKKYPYPHHPFETPPQRWAQSPHRGQPSLGVIHVSTRPRHRSHKPPPWLCLPYRRSVRGLATILTIKSHIS